LFEKIINFENDVNEKEENQTKIESENTKQENKNMKQNLELNSQNLIEDIQKNEIVLQMMQSVPKTCTKNVFEMFCNNLRV
jgi:hypothetical protein